MNKKELVENLAKKMEVSQAKASEFVGHFIDQISTALVKGDDISLVGFGRFHVTKRAARAGRNPSTGAAIEIKAAKLPKFTPGKSLKEAVNKSKKK